MIPVTSVSGAVVTGTGVPQDIQHYMRPGTLQLAALPPLSLYVHLPWCIRKCPYCDFNSHEMRVAELPEQRYLDALMADLEAALPLVWGRAVHSIFIGGGTPSLFSPEAIDRLLGAIRARLRLEPDCEITLEANPGTFEKDRFRAFRAAGVTRLSIGVQSFNDEHLRALGRVHDRAQALAAVEEAAQSFDTFNLDIMYALPGQTPADLTKDMTTALALAPPHISVYHLTIEPNTYFARFPPVIPEEDAAYDMLDLIAAFTTSTTGSLVTTWGWGRGRTASSVLPIGWCGRCAFASPGCTWSKPWPATVWPRTWRSAGRTCRLSSCSMPCV